MSRSRVRPQFPSGALAWLLAAVIHAGPSVVPRSARAGETNPPPVATYSIVAFDPVTGDLGVAVQSKFFGVGSVVPYARAGVGAIASQSYANPNYGPDGFALLARGWSAEETLAKLTGDDARRDIRQAGIVDAHGRAASHTGAKCLAWAGHQVGTNFAVQGNILAGEAVVRDMAAAFERARAQPETELADWLMSALAAAEAAGGDRRGRQSAALLVVREKGGYDQASDRYIDLRVEDHPEPVAELARLLRLHQRFYAGAHRNKPAAPPLAPPMKSAAPASAAKSPPAPSRSRVAWLSYALVTGALVFILAYAARNAPPPALGVHGGRLTTPPETPNGVGSQAPAGSRQVAPFHLDDRPLEAGRKLLAEAVGSLSRVSPVESRADYLRFECRSALFGFVDDLELFLDEAGGTIHVRSAARAGYWDLGVNRRRVEAIRARLPAGMQRPPP